MEDIPILAIQMLFGLIAGALGIGTAILTIVAKICKQTMWKEQILLSSIAAGLLIIGLVVQFF